MNRRFAPALKLSLATLTFVGVALTGACGGSVSTPTNMVALNGNAQSGSAGTALAQVLTVKVTDLNGEGVAGVTVNWSATIGNGSVAPAQPQTGLDGTVSATATLGPSVGTQTFTATAAIGTSGAQVTFSAIGSAGPAAGMTMFSGDNQTGGARSALLPLVVRVVDAFGNPAVGTTVTFAATSGGGTVSPLTAEVQQDGTAYSIATLGPTLGQFTFTASIAAAGRKGSPTGSPVTFHATSQGLLANAVGGGQTMLSGATVPLSIMVTDYAGLGLPNVTVNWSVVSGTGTVGATSMTNASGVATINAVAGTNLEVDVFKAAAVGAAPATEFQISVL
jgi:hypothetical protein